MTRPRLSRSLRVVALGVACLGAIETTAGSAGAQAQSSPSADAALRPLGAAPARTWYGNQTIVVDVASTLLMVGGLAGHVDAVFLIGLAGYAFGGPAIHAVHGRPEITLASFFVRFAVPAVTGLIGAGIGDATLRRQPSFNDGSFLSPPVAGALVGVPLGMVGAMVLDSSLLAWTPAPPTARPRPVVTLAPRLAIGPDRDHAVRETVVVEGTF